MAILFGNAASRNQSKNLLEFKAGKMSLKGNMVHPDKRKGLIYVHQTDDSLMHFCWKDRTSGAVEDDLIIFPDDVEYKRVAQCTTGRVYVLKFKSTNRKCFFWMQEPKTEKDDEYCQKVNEYLNNPPAPGSNRSGGSTPGALGADLAADGDLQNLFSAMNQQQFMQLLGGMGGVGGMANLSSLLGSHGLGGSQFGGSSSQRSLRRSALASASSTAVTTTAAATTTSSTTTTTPSSAPSTAAATTPSAATTTPAAVVQSAAPTPSTGSSQIQLSDLQNILSGISVQPGTENQTSQQSAVDLSTAMTSEALQPILSNPEFMQSLQAFLPNTGEASSTSSEQLRSTVQSPQFQQAVSMFSAALQSGQLGPLMQQFGLGEDVASAASQGDLEAFVNALQTSQGKNDKKDDKEGGGKDKDKDDDDEEMALD